MKLENVSHVQTMIAMTNAVSEKAGQTPLMQTLFKFKKGVKTQTVSIVRKDYSDAELKYMERRSKSGDGNALKASTLSKPVELTGLHLPAYLTLESEDIVDIPDFDSQNRESILSFEKHMQSELEEATTKVEKKREQACLDALVSGAIKEDDGTEALNLHEKFKTSEQVASLSRVRFLSTLNAAKSKSKKALKGETFHGFIALCGEQFYADLLEMKTLQNFMNNPLSQYVAKGFSDGFMYQGVNFVEHAGVESETAVLAPLLNQY